MAELLRAVDKGDDNQIRGLLESGASVHYSDAQGLSALHVAASLGRAHTVHSLVRHGAQTSAQTLKGNTPLHLACFEGHERVIAALAEHGANFMCRNHAGKTPLDVAQRPSVLVRILTTLAAETGGEGAVHWSTPFEVLELLPALGPDASNVQVWEAFAVKFRNILSNGQPGDILDQMVRAFLVAGHPTNRRALAQLCNSMLPANAQPKEWISAGLQPKALDTLQAHSLSPHVASGLATRVLEQLGLSQSDVRCLLRCAGRCTPDDLAVVLWTEQVGVSPVAQALLAHQVDVETLPQLSEADLIDMNVDSQYLGPLAAALAALQRVENRSPSEANSIPPPQNSAPGHAASAITASKEETQRKLEQISAPRDYSQPLQSPMDKVVDDNTKSVNAHNTAQEPRISQQSQAGLQLSLPPVITEGSTASPSESSSQGALLSNAMPPETKFSSKIIGLAGENHREVSTSYIPVEHSNWQNEAKRLADEVQTLHAMLQASNEAARQALEAQKETSAAEQRISALQSKVGQLVQERERFAADSASKQRQLQDLLASHQKLREESDRNREAFYSVEREVENLRGTAREFQRRLQSSEEKCRKYKQLVGKLTAKLKGPRKDRPRSPASLSSIGSSQRTSSIDDEHSPSDQSPIISQYFQTGMPLVNDSLQATAGSLVSQNETGGETLLTRQSHVATSSGSSPGKQGVVLVGQVPASTANQSNSGQLLHPTQSRLVDGPSMTGLPLDDQRVRHSLDNLDNSDLDARLRALSTRIEAVCQSVQQETSTNSSSSPHMSEMLRHNEHTRIAEA